jgi:ornithine cyclodeaminase
LWQAIFACAVRPIRTIFYVSRSDAAAERFESELASRLPVVARTRCSDARELLERTTLIVTATTASTPVLPDEPALLEGKHFIGIGSFKPDQQELPTAVCRIAGHLAIDSPAALRETGDVIRPLESGAVRSADVFHIAELIAGQRTIDVGRTTVFKSVGMALYDLYVAAAFHECAVAKGIGTHAAF